MIPVIVLLVVILLIGGEVLVRTLARRWTVERLQALTGGTVVAIDITGSPVTWHLLRRRVPAITVVARNVPVGDGDASIHELQVDLTDVTLPRGRTGTARHRPLTARQGRFRAVLDQDDLVRLADLPRVVRSLRLTAEGTVEITTVAGVRMTATLDTRDGAIVVRPDGGLLGALEGVQLTIPLPDLPAGAVVAWVEVRGRVLVAGGPVDGDKLAGR